MTISIVIFLIITMIAIVITIRNIIKNKPFKKKTFIIFQLAIIVIFGFVSYQIYSLSLDNLEQDIHSSMLNTVKELESIDWDDDFIQEMRIAIGTFTNNAVLENGFTKESINETYLSKFQYDYPLATCESPIYLEPDNYDLDDYAIYLKIYDSNDEEIATTTKRNNIIFFESLNESGDTSFKQINLNEFFDDDEITNFLNFYHRNQSQRLQIHTSNTKYRYVYIKQLAGYYKNDKFYVEEIVLEDNTDNSTYTLGKVKNKNDIILYSPYDEYTLNKNDEVGIFYCYFFDTSNENYNKVYNCIGEENLCNAIEDYNGFFDEDTTLIKNDGIYCYGDKISLGFDSDNGSLPYSFTFGAYVNTPLMTLKSRSFQNIIIYIFCIMECISLFGINLYTLYIKRKRALDETRNTFINAMAHEMKTPTAVILNSTEIIRENIFPEKMNIT